MGPVDTGMCDGGHHANMTTGARCNDGESWECQPLLRHARVGWLAMTPPTHPYRIAVVGHNEEDAKHLFAAELREWERLHKLAQSKEPDA